MDDEYWSLIVDGYIREQNEMFKLIIPDVINELICRFYAQNERFFDKFSTEQFRVENERRTIIPIGDTSRAAKNYTVYPSPNGFTKGIHKWAVRFISGSASTRYIGITTEMDDKSILEQVEDTQSFGVSRWRGSYRWYRDQTIEVILDLNKFTVSYYKIKPPNDITKLKEDTLKENTTYYFAMCIDADNSCCVFESVAPQVNP